jgi:hypothetical protein
LICRIFLSLFLVFVSARAHADCADLLSDLSEIEVGTLKRSAFDIRKVLERPGLEGLDPILNFVGSRFHEEALDRLPIVVPALLMHPGVSRIHLEKIMQWIQHAEHKYLLIARDDIIEALKEDRFFKVVMNLNKLREPMELSKQIQFIEDLEAVELRVGDQSIQEWLG